MGTEGFSDAAAYAVRDDLLIVQSLDFFPPLVDDPFVFGQIAAANSLSDVYAMGARPITALNIVGFPDDELELAILIEILRGGADRIREAGAVVAGGHSVRDAEIKYGMSVTGVVRARPFDYQPGGTARRSARSDEAARHRVRDHGVQGGPLSGGRVGRRRVEYGAVESGGE